MSLQYYFLKYLTRQSEARSRKLLLATLFSKQRRLFSSSSDSSDDENESRKSNKAKSRLHELLSSYNEDNVDKKPESSSSILNNFQKDVTKKIEEPPKENEEIVLKEDTKKQMMNILLTFNKKTYNKDEEIKIPQAQPNQNDQEQGENTKEEPEEIFIDFSVKKAVEDVAELLEGDKEKISSELLHSLQSVTLPKRSLSDTISQMKVSKAKSKPFGFDPLLTSRPQPFDYDETLAPRSRLHEFRNISLPERQTLTKRRTEEIDVFDAKPLNIFPKDFQPEGKESILNVWDSLLEREKQISVTQQPRNYFEEMISWTEKGKVWTFPIDNEIGLEEEKSYTFADHIFLEKHLEGWCPSKGPIRHFMELVCVGLSKNPFITVNRKIAHIEWFKNYFEDKKGLLQELGAL